MPKNLVHLLEDEDSLLKKEIELLNDKEQKDKEHMLKNKTCHQRKPGNDSTTPGTQQPTGITKKASQSNHQRPDQHHR